MAKVLGRKIAQERARQRYTVKSAAAAAGIARDTWKRIEMGVGVHDTSRVAALELLGLREDGSPAGASREVEPTETEGGTEYADPVLVEKLADVVYNLGQLAAEEAARTGHSPTLKEMLERMISGEEIPLAARDKGRRSAGQTRRHHQDTQTEETS